MEKISRTKGQEGMIKIISQPIKKLKTVEGENGKQEKRRSRYSFRDRKSINPDPSYLTHILGEDDNDDDDYQYSSKKRRKGKKKGKSGKVGRQTRAYSISLNSDVENEVIEPGEHYYDQIVFAKLPRERGSLERMAREIQGKIKMYEEAYLGSIESNKHKISDIPETSVPISVDVMNFNFKKLADKQMKHGGRLFDVIMMDPPWQLSTSQPSRGVAIGYSSLGDEAISRIPLHIIQKAGFLFVWVINAKYSWTIEQMGKWGYDLVDEIVWVKQTVNGKIAKGHGFYLQHAKETCLVGVKRASEVAFKGNVGNDVIFSRRRGQSQKPNEIYELIEELVPNGFYLEIFGRRNNLRDKWITIGNEL